MDKRNIRAQAAIEFMMLAAVLLFVFIMIFAIISYNVSSINKKKENIVGEDIVTKVQKEINLAARVLDGYSREFYIPLKFGKGNYEINISGNEVILYKGQNTFWRRIPEVVGNITAGTNIIRKENGTIYLN